VVDVPFLIAAPFFLALIPPFALASIIPARFARTRYFAAVISFVLCVTPSWASATIVSVPVPFGLILWFSAFPPSLDGIATTIRLWPIWHLVVFPLTATLGAFVFRRLRPNNSLKRTNQSLRD
jgi:hypothetical protein